jgi:hypothetical protein
MAVTYDPEQAAAFCAAMASTTDSIATICKRKGMPSKATVFRWRAKSPEFKAMYEAAKEDQLYAGIEECIEIADTAEASTEGIQKAKLRIYARLEVAQRLKPKTLGAKIDVNHGGQDGNPIKTESKVTISAEEAYKRMLDGGA